MSEGYTLHEDPRSGNCYKIKMVASYLGIPLTIRAYDILKGETRTPEFAANVSKANAIPVLEIQGDPGLRFIPESNAACWYLAEGSDLIPEDRFTQAEMLRWMFFEQNTHEPNIATLRFWYQFVGVDNLSEEQKAMITAKSNIAASALRLLEDHLATRDWMVGDAATLADVVLFPYTQTAEESRFPLANYPAIGRWLERVENVPALTPPR